MTRRRLVRKAKEAVLHAGQAAYVGRKDKKSVVRRDWILHINEAVKPLGSNYSTFMHNLKNTKVELDRKVLSDLATQYPEVLKEIFNFTSPKRG